ncbi:MAG: Na+/Ca+ antiporter, CaCA family [Candidatus Magasanikbacteria bacterium GW2011_GWA2_56_11]|uniref:Na+/Ca+ antiporter, CaCA family n=1 Tax=Candidatus Magasanikbacteria bacterium GW2011_GWA2_56_11 TaxID=1619044 RepID=A0A0G2ANB8_9BACT|nr:MAG: Na+/Ca+ antiporter, CaCA family [Candidatus Magasanikbacteria bacterium GW2011_GWA2_56_11]
MWLALFLILIGLGILIAGGDALVRGAASLAKRLGVAPIVIGLTIVAFGTSAPELIVNIFSAIRGTTDIAIGNVVGSNIANILLILGVSAVIFPLRVGKGTVWKEIPLALLSAIMVLVLANDARLDGLDTSALTRTDGLALIAFFAIFIYYTFGVAKAENGGDSQVKTYSHAFSLLFIVGGLVALFFGGKLLVDNAIILARMAGLSELLIGTTIVAVGTSLPELVTSVIAALKRHDDIAIGNVVGSNIFNVFWILGLTSIMKPLPVLPSMNADILVNVVATLLLFSFMFIHTKHRLNRWQGVMFIGLYIAYTTAVIIRG